MKPLDGAKLKVDRAEEHLNCLKDEVRSYLDSRPYAIPASRVGNVTSIGATVITEVPSPRLGCIFGDCLNNLRSSLDYIAWELAIKHTPPALLTKRGRDVYFPINKSAKAFATDGRPKLQSLSFPLAVLDEIEAVQPYNSAYEPLGVLNDLVKTDKHRLPLLTIATADTDSISWNTDKGTITIEFSDTAFDGPVATPLDPDNHEVDRIMQMLVNVQSKSPSLAISSQQSTDINVDGKVTVFVSLKNSPTPNEPIDGTLTQIFKCVSNVILKFERFLA